MQETWPELPVRAVFGELDEALAQGHALLHAPPGSGKTTLVPLALRDAAWLAGRRILMLEPRRIAARAAARRMAQLLGEAVGERVGFCTRFERRVSARTRIEVVTEGILIRRLQDDPELEGVGLLIFDEFHERSLQADLALALSLDVAAGLREDLHILVMSATLDERRLNELLPDAVPVSCEGRRHPVEIAYALRRAGRPLAQRMSEAILRLHGEARADLLAFLPGAPEIRRVEALLREQDPGLLITPLYGDLAAQAQDRALFPDPDGRRRVILATDIAETSLTIEGVDTVIDSGLCKRPRFDPNSGMSRLETLPISCASADQRAGRAGRLGPGRCLRLWTQAEQGARPAHQAAEILHADLAPLALELLRWGVSDPDALAWVDAPPRGAWQQALELLRGLGALGRGGGLSETGQRMARLPLHPRLARLVLEAAAWGDLAHGAALAALLSERDILRGDAGRGADLAFRLECLEQGRGERGALARVRRVASQIEAMARRFTATASGEVATPGELLAVAFPERVAQRHARHRYRLANGRIARLDESDPLVNADWLVVAELDGGQRDALIRRATAFDPRHLTVLDARPEERLVLRWREQEARFEAIRETCVEALVIERRTLSRIPDEALAAAWREQVRRRGVAWLSLDEATRQWLNRVTSLHHWLPGEGWPRLDDEALLARFDDWLAPWLAGVRSLKALRALDHGALLKGLLDWDAQQRLERLAPPRLRVPSGSCLRLHYAGDGAPPVLKVRLQELFGLEDTPRVCEGRVPVLIHLLSPAQRPVQVTSDLAGFWDSTYAEVRRELRGRYPKHDWPEDPRAARSSRGVRPR